jgi:hypothetical protein
MRWNDQELTTYGQILDAVTDILHNGTREQAHEFMAAYRAETPHAATNIGYLAGYCSTATATKIFDWFECAHPIFGTHVPTPDEAFHAGQQLAQS